MNSENRSLVSSNTPAIMAECRLGPKDRARDTYFRPDRLPRRRRRILLLSHEQAAILQRLRQACSN